MGQLALIEDLYRFRGEVYPPTPALDDAAQLKANAELVRASDAVRGMLRRARYARRADGLPAREDQRTAIVNATCAQAAAVIAAGGDFTGAAPEYSQVSLIGVQFAKAAEASTTTAAAFDSEGYALEARRILTNAGMFSTAVTHPGRR